MKPRPISATSLSWVSLLCPSILRRCDEVPDIEILSYLWLHIAPVDDILNAISNDDVLKQVASWGLTQEPNIICDIGITAVRRANLEIAKLWIDKKSGFIPFADAPNGKGALSILIRLWEIICKLLHINAKKKAESLSTS